MSSFPSAKRILFTATPFRHDKQEIEGRFIYTYQVRDAYRDQIFGEIEFVPVSLKSDLPEDVCICQEAERVFLEDRQNEFEHFLMVRTDTMKRASELEKVYKKNTELNLRIIHSRLTYRTIKTVINKLKGRELDGIICVNMLGEGFDFPNMKIAAIHSPHKSLEVTLQFIGRFARTGDENIGVAKFIAITSEIEIESTKLFEEGAVWQDGSGYMLTDESGKSKLLACQTEERQNDPECHHA